MDKVLSVFIDESGDFGFIKDASKYYIITLVFHDQSENIKPNIDRIYDKPVFHAGPIIRREYPFEHDDIIVRKKLFQTIFMFSMGLPIKCKSFIYEKKNFNNDSLKMEARMSRDIFSFFYENMSLFSDYHIIIYYDNGQHSITKIINSALSIVGVNYDFKREVHPRDYRLFQVADFISTVRLLEIKMKYKELSSSERMFIDERHLKKNYLKMINKKEI